MVIIIIIIITQVVNHTWTQVPLSTMWVAFDNDTAQGLQGTYSTAPQPCSMYPTIPLLSTPFTATLVSKKKL